jgi:DNA modification methylase
MGDYIWLAGMAKKKLKDGGLLAVQCGQFDLAKVIPIFKDFHYWTTLAIVWHQSCAATHSFLTNWRPVLLFSKGKKMDTKIRPVADTAEVKTLPVTDCITPNDTAKVKNLHDWQQPLSPFVRWIEALSSPGDLICDPFCCTGTNIVASKMTARRGLGVEQDADMVAVARKRLSEVK